MPLIKVDKFLGYHRISEKGTIDNPAVASDCENIIIDNGDICNIPYPKRVFGINHWIRSLISSYKEFIVYYASNGSEGTLLLKLIENFNNIHEFSLNNISNNFINVMQAYPEKGTNNETVSGNFVQVGNWLLFLSQFGFIQSDIELPYMVRVQKTLKQITRPTPILRTSTIGIKQPLRFSRFGLADNLGSINGTFDFAITFITSYDINTKNEEQILGPLDIESNATRLINGELEYNDALITFRVYLPKNHTGFVHSSNGIGIYAKESGEINYTLVKYLINRGSSTPTFDEEIGSYYYIFTLDTINRDETRIAPTTDIIPQLGSHDVPRPARHGAFYKERMYYASISVEKVEQAEGDVDPITTRIDIKNRLQYTMIPPGNDPNRDRYVNYVEGETYVGKDSEDITGVIAYRGQLIIFKETEAYVLTDDIALVSPRLLDNVPGCINLNGGKAYIVVGGVLYWGAPDGIYAYDGASIPVRISDVIQGDLEVIDKDRYSFMRLGHDPRYNLLYVNFPPGHLGGAAVLPSFIYNYKERVWTKTEQGFHLYDVISNHKNGSTFLKPLVYFNKEIKLEELGTLDEQSFQGVRAWAWTSSILTAGRAEKIKHWKLLRFGISSLVENLTKVVFSHSNSNSNVKDLLFTNSDNNIELYIGVHNEKVSFSLAQITINPFRITGYELEAHIQGRR